MPALHRDEADPGSRHEPARAGAGADDQAAVVKEYSLSYNQEFFCSLDGGDHRGAFGDRHTLVGRWWLTGPVDIHTLQAALDDVVTRHEILRTSIARTATPPYQLVHPPSTVRLEVRPLRESAVESREFHCERLMAEHQAEPFNVAELPLLRAVLGRFDERTAVLVLTVHHIACDAWSMQVLIRDLASCYARRRGFQVALPEFHQYREYCRAQRIDVDLERLRSRQDFWRAALRGARAFQLPTQPGPAPGRGYAMQNFAVTGQLVTAIGRLARDARSSPFMVLLSAFYLLAHRITGDTDLIVPPFTTGRDDSRFHHTIGPFLNLLPVRTDIAGCRTFREVLARTRASCLAAYSHDMPSELIESVVPGLFSSGSQRGRTHVAFEMVQGPAIAGGGPLVVGELSFLEVHSRLLADGDCPDLPDGMLWALSLATPGELVGTVQFSRAEFEVAAITELIASFRRLLAQSVAAPDAALRPAP